MKGELKAGGLALVIASTDKEDIGKCVTLFQLVNPGESYIAPNGVECRHNEAYPQAWVVTGDVATGVCDWHGWSVFPPSSLLPIDGDDDQAPEQLTKDKPAELTA